jgi:hypothetical protein
MRLLQTFIWFPRISVDGGGQLAIFTHKKIEIVYSCRR